MQAAFEVETSAFCPGDLSATVNLDVVMQHAEDASFLFMQRGHALRASRMRLGELQRLDERLEANLDGLRVAGSAGRKVALEGLAGERPAAIFTAACIAVATGDPDFIDAVLGASLHKHELRRALVAGFGFAFRFEALPVLQGLLQSPFPGAREAALGGLAAHRLSYRGEWDDPWPAALLEQDPAIRSIAFAAAGTLGRTDLAHLLARHMAEQRTDLRFHAAWSAARLGNRDRDVLDTLLSFAEATGAFAEDALEMWVRCARVEEAERWVYKLLVEGRRPRLALTALATLGTPSLLEHSFVYLTCESTARLAGEAFSRLTGASLKDASLDRPKPEHFDAGPNDDPADSNVSMDAEDGLPWPAPELIRAWWSAHAHQFEHGARYLCGRRVHVDSLLHTLRNGYQRERAAAALELGLLLPAEPLFPIHARARQQRKILDSWAVPEESA